MPDSRFSKLFLDLLQETGTTQSSLSTSTNVSYSYTNHVLTGRQHPSAKWLDLVAETMSLPDDTRRKMHRAAAIDVLEKKGYDVDLTEE